MKTPDATQPVVPAIKPQRVSPTESGTPPVDQLPTFALCGESMDSDMRNLDQRTAQPVAAEIANKNGKPEVFPPRLAFTIQDTAHVLGGVCPTTVRRLISRNLLHPSRGLRCPLIPIWEVVRYLSDTMPATNKRDDRLIRILFESVLASPKSKTENGD